MKLNNIWFALKDQLPLKRFVQNLLKGHLLGLLSERSHLNASGAPKIAYSSKVSAEKAATAMSKKNGVHFSNYKCMHCDGYHLGKNRSNKPD